MSGCTGDDSRTPARLADGTTARTATIAFEGVDAPVVMTTQAATAPGEGCDSRDAGDHATAVRRVDTLGTSITVLSSDGRRVWACDSTSSNAACGRAFGRVDSGVAFDPRLSLTCRDAEGGPLGFMWVQPSIDAGYVVVRRRGYAEAYPVRGTAPIRVTADNVDPATSSASVDVSEHGPGGARLRQATEEAHVSD